MRTTTKSTGNEGFGKRISRVALRFALCLAVLVSGCGDGDGLADSPIDGEMDEDALPPPVASPAYERAVFMEDSVLACAPCGFGRAVVLWSPFRVFVPFMWEVKFERRGNLVPGRVYDNQRREFMAYELHQRDTVEKRGDLPTTLNLFSYDRALGEIYREHLLKAKAEIDDAYFDGYVVLTIEINEKGNVVQSMIRASTTGNGEFDEAVRRESLNWRFDLSRSNVLATFSIEFAKTAADGLHGSCISVNSFGFPLEYGEDCWCCPDNVGGLPEDWDNVALGWKLRR